MTVAGFLATVARRVRDPAGRLVQVVAARAGLLRRQQDRVHGLGGQPVAARDHHPVRRVHQRRHQALAGRRLRRRRRSASWPRRCSTAPGYPMVALLTTALTGLLASPISWDHHWVWVAPGVAVAGHYAIRAWRAGEKWRARWIAALAAGIIFVVRRLAGRAVGARPQPRQVLARLPVGAEEHQPDPVQPARRPAAVRRVPLAWLPAAVGQHLHPRRHRPAADPGGHRGQAPPRAPAPRSAEPSTSPPKSRDVAGAGCVEPWRSSELPASVPASLSAPPRTA